MTIAGVALNLRVVTIGERMQGRPNREELHRTVRGGMNHTLTNKGENQTPYTNNSPVNEPHRQSTTSPILLKPSAKQRQLTCSASGTNWPSGCSTPKTASSS